MLNVDISHNRNLKIYPLHYDSIVLMLDRTSVVVFDFFKPLLPLKKIS